MNHLIHHRGQLSVYLRQTGSKVPGIYGPERRRKLTLMRERDDAARPWPRPVWGLAALVFVVVATLNSAGYRFGVGDQAFYLPAIQRHLEPESFPRDRIVIDDQDRLNVFPRVAAALIRPRALPPPALFLGLYVVALLLLSSAGARAGRAPGALPVGAARRAGRADA